MKNCYTLLGENVAIRFVLQSFDEAIQEVGVLETKRVLVHADERC